MDEDSRLAAAIVDAVSWDDWRWAESVLSVLLGVPEPRTSSRTAQFFEARGWRDVTDAYDAARVSAAQRQAFELHLSGHSNREIGGWMGTSALAAKLQVFRAMEKLRRAVGDEPDVTVAA
jgi:DNA-directed RNA polymerase specialized sigma24 family protein